MGSRSSLKMGVALVVFGVGVLSSLSTGLAQRPVRRGGILAASGDPQLGGWDKYTLWDLEAIHAALVPTGTLPNIVWRVLVWDYGTYSDPNQGGNDSTTIEAKLWNWDPTCTVGCFTDVPLTIPNSGGATIVSAGHSFLDDGRLVVTGGAYLNAVVRGPFINYAFNSATSTWQTNLQPLTANVCDPPNLNNPDCIGGRYYPTNVTVKSPFLNEAHVLSVHGMNNLAEALVPNRSVERYSPSTNEWFVDSRPLIPINPLQAQYPWLHVLPAEPLPTVLFSGHFDGFDGNPPAGSRFAHKYVVGTETWTRVGAARIDHKHASGTSVLLTVVDPAGGGDGGRVLIAGGANAFDAGITASAKLLCVAPVQHARCPGSEGWQIETAMSYAQQHLDAVILPDEKVVILGGESAGGCGPPGPLRCPGDNLNQCVPVYHAELYDPAVPWPSNPWRVVDPPPALERRPRQYHSIKFLLPDGSVLMAGGDTDANPRCFPAGPSAQIYKPGYFFRGPRPRINAMALQREVAYNQEFTVTIDQNVVAGKKVVLLRAGSVTHGFNFDQRLVELRTVRLEGPNTLRVQAPLNANVAPPGYYLLFFVQPSPQGPLPSQLGEFIRVRF